MTRTITVFLADAFTTEPDRAMQAVTRDASGPHKVQVGGTAVEAGRLEIELSDKNGNISATIL